MRVKKIHFHFSGNYQTDPSMEFVQISIRQLTYAVVEVELNSHMKYLTAPNSYFTRAPP